MPQMIGSFEERQAELREALTSLLLPDRENQTPNGYLCVEATYPDMVVCTVTIDNDDDSYQVPYSFSPDGDIALGLPEPVKLSVVASPDDDDDDPDSGEDEADADDAVMVRFLGPAASAIGDAVSYVMSTPSGTEGKAFEPIRTQLLRLLDGLAVKGMDMQGISDPADPADPDGDGDGAADTDGDGDGGDEDPWAGLLDPDPELAPDAGGDAALGAGDASLSSDAGETGTPDGATTSGDYPPGDDSSASGDGMVHLDPDQVKAELAGLQAKGDDEDMAGD